MKIVINRCFGGAGLSKQAVDLILEQKGIQFEVVKNKSFALKESYYHKGHAGDEKYYISDYSLLDDRTDPVLISVIERLGQNANGFAADLAVIEIPDDVQWQLEEYDGREWIAEKHRRWE